MINTSRVIAADSFVLTAICILINLTGRVLTGRNIFIAHRLLLHFHDNRFRINSYFSHIITIAGRLIIFDQVHTVRQFHCRERSKRSIDRISQLPVRTIQNRAFSTRKLTQTFDHNRIASSKRLIGKSECFPDKGESIRFMTTVELSHRTGQFINGNYSVHHTPRFNFSI